MSLIIADKQKAMRPGRFRVFMRTFVVWQIIRFLIVNIKMTGMILKSHGGQNKELKDER